jgi:peptide/nickel transport system substrate-binding protein
VRSRRQVRSVGDCQPTKALDEFAEEPYSTWECRTVRLTRVMRGDGPVVRPRHRIWIATIVAIAATAGIVVAVRSTAGDDSARRPQVVVWGASQAFPDNFFPIIGPGSSVSTANIGIQVFPAPFRVRPDLTVVHDRELLTSEPASVVAGGRQIVTYRLNRRAKWSDGDPIGASDFEFSWRIQRSSDPARGGCPALLSTSGYDQIESVTGTDGGRTVVVTLTRPYADWKVLFRQQLFPAHLMDSGDAATNCTTVKRGWPDAEGIPVSGGPWKVDKADVDPDKKTVILTPNPAYWGSKPKLERLIWQSFPGDDPGAMLSALRAGEITMADPPAQLDLLEPLRALEPTVVTEIRPGLSFEHLDFNVRNFHLAQKAVREAIATGLDRSDLVRSTVGQIDPDAQVLNNRIYMTSQPEYEATNGGRYERGDVPAARRLLEGAGYRVGADGVYVKNGARLSLELMTTQGNRMRVNAVDVIAAQLRRVGFEIRTFVNRDIFADKEAAASLESGRFDMALYSWLGAPFLTGNESIYASPQGESIRQNYTRGGDRRVDRLFERLSVATTAATIAEIANQIDTLLWENLFTIPLFQRPIIAAHHRAVANVVINPSADGLAWNADDWTVD